MVWPKTGKLRKVDTLRCGHCQVNHLLNPLTEKTHRFRAGGCFQPPLLHLLQDSLSRRRYVLAPDVCKRACHLNYCIAKLFIIL